MGSEMCIRDSPSAGLDAGQVVMQVDLPEGLAGLLVAVVHGTLFNCLLYTSDAADERSSVDLGGRRIIKKTTVGPRWPHSGPITIYYIKNFRQIESRDV